MENEKKEVEFVPFTWEDRRNLWGLIYHRKDFPNVEFMVTKMENDAGSLLVDGRRAEFMLDMYEFDDGTKFGKKEITTITKRKNGNGKRKEETRRHYGLARRIVGIRGEGRRS